jgi:hypothetical protein
MARRVNAFLRVTDWEAAAADWSRAATGKPDGVKLLAEFARRLAAGEQVPLANDQLKKSQALYERSLEADPGNDVVAMELAQLLLENDNHENAGHWTVLKPAEARSELGATLSILAGDSILASGANPLRDRYRVVLNVGAPARFRFFQSTTRKNDPPGSLLDDIDEEFEELTPIEVSLSGTRGESVPVTLETLVTETGVLELWCVARDGRRWKLEFNVRSGQIRART